LPLLKPDGLPARPSFTSLYARRPDQPVQAAGHVLFQRRSRLVIRVAAPGALGPRRVKMNDDGTLPPPPFGLVDNEYSILADSDLVFIDRWPPVSAAR